MGYSRRSLYRVTMTQPSGPYLLLCLVAVLSVLPSTPAAASQVAMSVMVKPPASSHFLPDRCLKYRGGGGDGGVGSAGGGVGGVGGEGG